MTATENSSSNGFLATIRVGMARITEYPLPADDYWFTLKLEDGREAKGHFSLKR